MPKKFLDAEGVTYLASLLDNYPNNEILGTVIDAIQDALDEKNDKAILTYGVSTFNDFLTAYNAGSMLFCKVTQEDPTITFYSRYAPLIYVQPDLNFIEFLYYRPLSHNSVSYHDEICIYKLTNQNEWTTSHRANGLRRIEVSGDGLSIEWADGIATLTTANATTTTAGMMSSSDKTKLDGIEEIDPYETINTPAPLIHLTDAAEAPVKEMEIEIDNPIQYFNGYDHSWIGGIGKNKLPIYGYLTSYPSSVISYFHNFGDGSIYIGGTSLTDFDAWLCNDGKFRVNPSEEIIGIFHYSGNYIVSGSSTNPPATIQFYNINTEEIDASGNGQFTLDGDYNIKIHCENNTQYKINIWPMLRLASVVDDTFEKYENICPITGYTGIQLRTANKNLFSINFDTFTRDGVTYSCENSYIIMNGTHQGQALYNFSNYKIYLPAGTYNVDYRLVSGTVTAPEGNTDLTYGSICIFRSNDNSSLLEKGISYSTQQINRTLILTQGENISIGIRKQAYVTFTNAKFLLTITRAEDIITDGIPHEGKVYDIATAETVYGGKLTIYGNGSGKVSINKKFYHLTADDTIGLAEQQISGFNRFTFTPNSGNVKYASTKYLACDKLPKVTSANPGIGIFGYNATNICFLSNLSTIEAFKEWLTEIGGLDIVYELGTPITYQLTSPQVQTLLSENNIWANSGNINKITYIKDINGLISGADKAIIDRLISNNPQNKYWKDDGTLDSPVAILEYGASTWNDFLDAYNKNKDIYCKISHNNGYRIGHFDYYYYGSPSPYVEFNYYRSPESNNSADEVYKYRLYYNTNTWDTIVKEASTPTMVGCSANAAGSSGSVPAPAAGDQDKFLSGDGTYKSGGLPMVVLSYGNSTWDDFINAYNNNVIVYCRASSNVNPASGSQTRMAFMAYVNNGTNPTEVEFQYYRSVSSHSASQMSDQVFVYKLNKTNGWSVTTREASMKQLKVANNSNMSISYSNNVATINGVALPAVTTADNGKILMVVNGVWTAVAPS